MKIGLKETWSEYFCEYDEWGIDFSVESVLFENLMNSCILYYLDKLVELVQSDVMILRETFGHGA